MTRTPIACALVVLFLGAAPMPASAQLDSAESTATLTAVLPESLGVSLLPNAVSFTLQSGNASNPGSVTITATTSWTLSATRTGLVVYGYFTSAGSALEHTVVTNTVDIPSSRVEASVNGGASVVFDQAVPFGGAGAGRLLATQLVTVATATGSRSDTIALNINLNNYNLPADTYTGTLRIRARATP
jgi:hypothetical protein